MTRRYDFVNVDVFTSRKLEGNQLAVFTDARGLSDAEMQALAREMRYSETTFVLPRDAGVERERGIKTRIFTVEEELPFAGHPTLGTAFVLASTAKSNSITLDLPVGQIPVRFEQSEQGLFGEMVQREPEFGTVHDPRALAQALRLDLEIIDANLPIETVSTGNKFAIVPLRSLAAIRTVAPDLRSAADYLEKTDTKFFYFVSRETENARSRLHARMMFYDTGEDPATGSAAGPAAAWMVKHGIAAPEEQVVVEQGLEIKRPSLIYVRASRTGGRVHNVRVGGYCVEVMRGTCTL